ncbi:MAG TPA: MogA/MoaB family molybdenum cofactor biosynthesis protein [Gemmatimonadota bacterium]|nr:MogA/MoaB family molybdenum cofactor biosynthesis protein [Gemmatimonadota bacterium]
MTAEMAWQRRAAVVTVSDRSAAGEREDESGPRLTGLLEELGWEVSERRIVPDEVAAIAAVLADLVGRGIRLILTTGGTGLSPRDVTPDATRSVADREVPGIAEALRAAGLGETPHAMLSRAIAAVRGRTLIVNLPGSPRGAESGLRTLAPVLDHAIALIAGEEYADAAHAAAEPRNPAAGPP